MHNTDLYTLQSELEYRQERARPTRVRRPRRPPYIPWLARYGGRKAL